MGSDVVITCLPLPHHVYENMVGPDGALEGMKKDSIWIDTSTTDYHNTLKIEALGIAKGVISLEAPVSNLSHLFIGCGIIQNKQKHSVLPWNNLCHFCSINRMTNLVRWKLDIKT